MQMQMVANKLSTGLAHLKKFMEVQWRPFEAEFGPILEDFKGHLNVLLHASVAHQSLQLRQVVTMVENFHCEMKTKFRRDEREAFMRWISPTDFKGIHENILERRHPKTCVWLIEEQSEFKEWISSQTSTLLWCHGQRE